jgi:hypothetical protein
MPSRPSIRFSIVSRSRALVFVFGDQLQQVMDSFEHLCVAIKAFEPDVEIKNDMELESVTVP